MNISLKEKPFFVKLSVKMLILSLIISAISFGISLATSDFELITIVVQSSTIILLGLFISMINNRKNWARLIFSIVTLVGSPGSLIMLFMELSKNRFSFIILSVIFFLQLTPSILLLLKPSASWFKAIEQSHTESDNLSSAE